MLRPHIYLRVMIQTHQWVLTSIENAPLLPLLARKLSNRIADLQDWSFWTWQGFLLSLNSCLMYTVWVEGVMGPASKPSFFKLSRSVSTSIALTVSVSGPILSKLLSGNTYENNISSVILMNWEKVMTYRWSIDKYYTMTVCMWCKAPSIAWPGMKREGGVRQAQNKLIISDHTISLQDYDYEYVQTVLHNVECVL